MYDTQFSKISVVGLGYIGLPTAAVLASRKVNVIGVDVQPSVVETINRGEVQIYEPDLDIVVRSAVTEGYLRASLTPEPAEAFLIAVPTPFVGESREPDLKYVEAACRSIAPVLEPGNLVILESTCPVGATEKVADWIADERPDLILPHTHPDTCNIHLAHCPERVLPGKVLRELVSNDRIVAGFTNKCTELAIDLYRIFVKGHCVTTNPRTAELAKLTENSFRDVNIAFANELSTICERLDVDVSELISLANLHPRVNILQPGPGVGGHCIAVDPWFIVASAPEQARLIRTAREVNDFKPSWVLEKIRSSIATLGQAKDVTLACYGVAFKPNIDDVRESPSLFIVKELLATHPGQIMVIEPNLQELPEEISGARLASLEDANDEADLHVILVAHDEFKGREFEASTLLFTSL